MLYEEFKNRVIKAYNEDKKENGVLSLISVWNISVEYANAHRMDDETHAYELALCIIDKYKSEIVKSNYISKV